MSWMKKRKGWRWKLKLTVGVLPQTSQFLAISIKTKAVLGEIAKKKKKMFLLQLFVKTKEDPSQSIDTTWHLKYQYCSISELSAIFHPYFPCFHSCLLSLDCMTNGMGTCQRVLIRVSSGLPEVSGQFIYG